jgi:hypothetical protein
VTNSGTGSVRQTTTGSTGVFNVPNLEVGANVLRVSATGFNTYERTALNLESNQVLNINVELAGRCSYPAHPARCVCYEAVRNTASRWKG